MKPGLDLKLVGIGGILAAVGAAIQAQWDNDPNTVAQWPVVIALVLGGIGGDISGEPALAGAERYDPATGTVRPVASPAVARYWHSATLLADGTVLVAGGIAGDGRATATAELYDPRSVAALVWGTVHSGAVPNVIPDVGEARGTLRMMDAGTAGGVRVAAAACGV